MNFAQPLWMISVGHIIGQACIATGVTLVALGYVSPAWLLITLAFHFIGSLMTTVGVHRYFSHAAFKTSKFWHNLMAFYSVLLLNGSALGWSTAHITHHVYSDTDRDPHYMKADYLLWKRYNPVKMVKRRLRHIIGDPVLQFCHRYGFLLWWLTVIALLAVSWKFALFAYGMSLGTVHLIGGIHQVTSHKNGKPRDLPWMEFILPASGEWMHGTHHERQSSPDLRAKWWHLDLGYQFIRLIRSK